MFHGLASHATPFAGLHLDTGAGSHFRTACELGRARPLRKAQDPRRHAGLGRPHCFQRLSRLVVASDVAVDVAWCGVVRMGSQGWPGGVGDAGSLFCLLRGWDSGFQHQQVSASFLGRPGRVWFFFEGSATATAVDSLLGQAGIEDMGGSSGRQDPVDLVVLEGGSLVWRSYALKHALTFEWTGSACRVLDERAN